MSPVTPHLMPSLVSVVIPNWNGRAYLETCLASLAAQTHPALEIIVVDNGSTDDSVAWLAEHHPATRVLRNTENRGFAAANNQGLQAARGVYLALLNNDAEPAPDWLAELVRVMEADARPGMVASRMVFADRPGVINSTGICVDLCGISWDRGGGQPLTATELEPTPVFGACAGAALYRRELFADIGLFDEDFFAYLEDVDLAWRARWRGWEAVYAPSAVVRHAHSGTSGEGSPFKTYHLSKNKIFLLAKNYPWPPLLFYLPLILFYELLSQGYAIVQRRGWSALRGRLAGLRGLAKALAKRRALRPRRSASEMMRWLEPVVWPWNVHRRYQHIPERVSPSRPGTSQG